MISLDEAVCRTLALAPQLETETIPLAQAAGRWLADEVTARRTQPARALSAMDGYAIAHHDLPGPWSITGVSAAGGLLPDAIGPKETVRIFTGAPLPQGADSVIMQEDVTVTDAGMTLKTDLAIPLGKHVRRAGEDFMAGQRIAEAGTLLTPATLALIAMAGHGTVTVRRPVRIALISTGDELAPLGTPLGDAQIPASNALMLQALLASCACAVEDLGIIPDDQKAIERGFAQAAQTADLIISTGGASVGDHDHVKPALEAVGADIDFWKIAMRPGKPLMAGTLGNAVVLGLPGNPVSAFVTAILFAKPLIAQMAGARTVRAIPEPAILDAPLPAVPNRTDHVRATLDQGRALPVGLNDSAALLALSRANALIVRPAGSPAALPGDVVQVIRIA